MSMTLHWFSGSPYVWRVQFAMELKSIPYVSRRMDMQEEEHHQEPFLRLNPRGKVPVLTHDNFILYESVAILAYLDSLHPEPPIFGEDARQTGMIWQRIAEFENYTGETLAAEVFRPLLFGRAIGQPEKARAGAENAKNAIDWMESALTTAPFLAGEAITAADIVAMPHMEMLARLGARPAAKELGLGFDNFCESYPAIQAWTARIATLPAYNASYPPHWRS